MSLFIVLSTMESLSFSIRKSSPFHRMIKLEIVLPMKHVQIVHVRCRFFRGFSLTAGSHDDGGFFYLLLVSFHQK